MAARASFSNDSKLVKVPLSKSVLLKDYLLDDLSSCSSNGFRSYPRRQCFTTVRYLIEIDLNKHIKLPPTQKQFLKTKSQPKQKSKSSSVLQKASAVVVNVFKNFHFSGSDKRRKTNFLPRNLSRKLSKHGFWKRTTEHRNKEFIKLNSFNEPIKEKENILHPPSTAVTTNTLDMKITSTSNSNSSVSSLDSYFSPTYDSSTTGSWSKINVAQNDIQEESTHVSTNHPVPAAPGNAKNERQSEEKDQLSPNSVMDFPCEKDNDDEDEVNSPFQYSGFCVEGTKRKERVKTLDELKPVRLEDRITLLESRTHSLESEQGQTEKKAMALLQQLKGTMCCSRSLLMTEDILLGFFRERITDGNVSNLRILQEAKKWMEGKMLVESDEMTLVTYIRDMEKWSKMSEKGEIVMEVEYQVFTCLIHEMLVDFCF